jgi:hypothetical protein
LSAEHPQGAPAMNATGTITMSMRELERFKVIEAVTEAQPDHVRKALSVKVIYRF